MHGVGSLLAEIFSTSGSFVIIYSGYELGLRENINLLHDRLSGNWQATPPMRIYILKSSGLLRPITLLAIEDQVVLQAIANKVALHVRARRRKVESKQIFSNCLERRANSVFFLQDWRQSYQAFQRHLQAHLDSGHTWIAHFDLAAFYEPFHTAPCVASLHLGWEP